MNTQHPILGLDLGKHNVFVAWPPDVEKDPQLWPTIEIKYKSPTWWIDFLDLVTPDAVLCAEPTGHHLLAPILALLNKYRPNARLFHVQGKTTAKIREAHVSEAKTDRLDAIALAWIARDVANGRPPRKVHLYDPDTEAAVQRLRMLVNMHRRLARDITRHRNRLNVFAFSLWPSFAGSDTWLRAVRSGAITPRQITDLAALEPPPPAYSHGTARRHLRLLAADLPDIDADPAVIKAIQDIEPQLTALELPLAELEQRIAAEVSAPPFNQITDRWRGIPNFSHYYAASIHVATHGQILTMSKDEFVAAVGSGPTTNSSGVRDKTQVQRKGYAPCRQYMYLWTLSLLRDPQHPITQYFNQQRYGHDSRSIYDARTKFARMLWGRARDARLDPPPTPAEEQ